MIEHPRVRCPRKGCGSYDVEAMGVKWPVRHFRCVGCGLPFQTYDKGPRRGKE